MRLRSISKKMRLVLLCKHCHFSLTMLLLTLVGCSSDRTPDDTSQKLVGEPILVRRLPNVSGPIAFRPGVGPPVLLTGDRKEDGTLPLWDVHTGECIAICNGEEGLAQPNCAAFSPDGRLLASASHFRDANRVPGFDLRLWDIQTAKDRVVARAHLKGRHLEFIIHSVAFSPDGKLLAAEGPGDQIILREVATGKIVNSLAGSQCSILSMAFRPDAKQIAAVDMDAPVGTPRVWDVNSGKLVRVLQVPDGGVVNSLAYSPNGKLLALAGGKNGTGFIDLWDAVSGQYLTRLDGHVGSITEIAFGKNRWLASGGCNNTLQLWDMHTRKVVKTFSFFREVQNVAFSSDGRWLAASYFASPERADVSIWDLGSDSTK